MRFDQKLILHCDEFLNELTVDVHHISRYDIIYIDSIRREGSSASVKIV